jgi:hypothetical protein
MKRFFPLLLLVSVAPGLAQEKPTPKPAVYRTLDKMLKEYRRQAEAKVVAAR